jgi:ParB-like chromosome segregation protein Spo0J
MVAIRGGLLDLVQSDAVRVPLERVRPGYSPRRGGVDMTHVDRLVETGGEWPPILVQRTTGRVVDGAHRLAAAGALGLATVSVEWFEGTDDEALVEAISRNRGHGLPLTLQDRKSAAAGLVGQHPEWSDGRIAEVCSLSPKTVGELRRRREGQPRPTGDAPGSDTRIGRDGRRHPLRSSPLRARIAEAIAADPGGSLRAIAAKAHASPETVRTVRRSLQAERPAPTPVLVGPLPTIDPELLGTAARLAGPDPCATTAGDEWSRDSACASTPEGSRFAAWFDRHVVNDEDLWRFPGAVPVSRSYEVIDEAHRRARFWAAFGARLEQRVRRAPS